MTAAIRKAELHAFVDGQLDAGRRRDVEAFLAANPEAARRVDAYRRQRRALRALLAPVMDEPLPRALQPPRPRRLVHVAWAAAAAVMLVAGGLAGWQLRGMGIQNGADGERAVADQAIIAHAVFTPQRRHPVEVGAAEEGHLVAWLSKVLGEKLRAPHLGDLGYALVGGRLLSAPSGPAAQFMYENPEKQRLTLYVVRDPDREGETAFRFVERKGVSVFTWMDGPLGYALAAGIPKAALFPLAQAVHRQLSR
jgi:anti-sigma factor RsiW